MHVLSDLYALMARVLGAFVQRWRMAVRDPQSCPEAGQCTFIDMGSHFSNSFFLFPLACRLRRGLLLSSPHRHCH